MLPLSLLLLALVVTAAEEIPTMMSGQTVSGQVYKADGYKGYHLLKVTSIDKKFLFITLGTEEIYKHLNMNLLFYRAGAKEPFKTCLKEEVDSCYIPKS